MFLVDRGMNHKKNYRNLSQLNVSPLDTDAVFCSFSVET